MTSSSQQLGSAAIWRILFVEREALEIFRYLVELAAAAADDAAPAWRWWRALE